MQSRYSQLMNSEKSTYSVGLNMDDICIELTEGSQSQAPTAAGKAAEKALEAAANQKQGRQARQETQLEQIVEEQEHSSSLDHVDLPKAEAWIDSSRVPRAKAARGSSGLSKDEERKAHEDDEALIERLINEDLDLHDLHDDEKRRKAAADLSEQRIRQYQHKVLSAISDSAKKKQMEQKDILKQIEQQRHQDKSKQSSETPSLIKALPEGTRSPAPGNSRPGHPSGSAGGKDAAGQPAYDDLHDRESIARELQQIISRNRAIFDNDTEKER